MNTPITELELFVSDTNALAVNEKKRAELIAVLKPIADNIQRYVEDSENVVVTNEGQAKAAAQYRDLITEAAETAEKAIRSFDDNLLERLFKTHRKGTQLISRFAVLYDAARKFKQKILGWQAAEAEKAEAERSRLQALADEAARKEKERLEKLAESRKTEEKKEMYREQAAAVVAPVIHVATAPKAVSGQSRWFVKGVDPVKFVEAAAQDKSLLGYITIDQGKLARAKAANDRVEIPGIVFEKRLV